jgi:hypothetical protein
VSTARGTLTVVGQAVGSIWGPVGAAVGGVIGGELGGLIDGPPEGPQLDDLSAPAIEFGAKVPWVEGCVWCEASPLWWSGLRESSNVQGGKGGDSGVRQYEYHADVLFRLANGANVVDWTRIEIDGQIVATRLASSSADSLANSAATERWSDVALLTGGPSQVPWPVYEAAVGADNASAYIGQCTIGFQNFWMRNGRTPSRVRVEVTTNCTTASVCLAGSPVAEDGWVAGAAQWTGSDWNPFIPAVLRNWTVGGNVATLGPFANYWWLNEGEHIQRTFRLDAESAYSGGCRYAEVHFPTENTSSSNDVGVLGVCDASDPNVYWGSTYDGFEIASGVKGSALSAASWSSDGDVVMLAYKDGKLWIGKNGAWSNGGDPSAGTGAVHTGIEVEMRIFLMYYPHIPEVQVELMTAEAQFTYPIPEGFGSWGAPFVATEVVTPQPEDLRDVLERMALRCRPLTLDELDFAAAAGMLVHGYKYVGSAAQAMQPLLTRHYLDLYCDDKLRLVQRGGAVEQSAAFAWSGAGGAERFAGLVRGNDTEVRKRTAITYINRLSDGEADTVNGERESFGVETETLRLPIAMARSEAQGVANAATWDKRVATHTATVHLGARHGLLLQPGSVMTVTDHQGRSYRVLVRRCVLDRWVWACDVRLDDPGVLVEAGIAVDDDLRVIEVAGTPEATLYLLDVPIVRDQDDAHGLYACVTCTGDSFGGARILASNDGTTYAEAATLTTRGIAGRCSTVLADLAAGAGTWTWDDASTLTVVLDEGAGGTLASATKAAIEADATLNVAWVGAHGRWECIRYASAELVDTRTYLLSGLLRGQQGTEHAIGTHEADDAFVKIQVAGLARLEAGAGDIGATRYFKAVPSGRSSAVVSAETVVYTAEGLKPYAPVDLSYDGATLSWNRRSRLAYPSPYTGQPMLGEASESYDVRLMDGVTEMSSATVSTPAWTVQAYANDFALEQPSQFVYEQGGLLHGVLETTSSFSYRQQTLAGAAVANAYLCSHAVFGVAHDGAAMYAACYNGPVSATVRRVDTSVPAVTHTNSYSPGDPQGVAFDGTDVWVSLFYDGTLRQLDKDDLTQLASHALNVGIGAMTHDSGSLWICDRATDEIVEWDIGTTTELQRFACVEQPLDVLVVGSLVFVAGAAECAVYDNTGAEQFRFDIEGAAAGRQLLARFDGKVAVGGPDERVILMDETTGEPVDQISVPGSYTVAGASSTHLLVAIGNPVTATQAFGEAVSLAGKVVEVYQNSAAIGRGHVAELEL